MFFLPERRRDMDDGDTSLPVKTISHAALISSRPNLDSKTQQNSGFLSG